MADLGVNVWSVRSICDGVSLLRYKVQDRITRMEYHDQSFQGGPIHFEPISRIKGCNFHALIFANAI